MLPGITPGVPGPPGREAAQDPLRAACKEFEAVLLQMLLREARRSAGPGEAGFARGVFEQWQDEQLAGRMSEAGGIGLSDLLLRHLGPAARRS